MPCVQMSLISGMLGKWTDMSCEKLWLVVCQKRQEITVKSFKRIVNNIKHFFEKKDKEFEEKNKQLEDEIKNLSHFINKQQVIF